MPSAASATNPVTSAVNGVLNSKPANAKTANNKSLIPTLGFRASNV
jgi:hypothetical protein